MEIHNSTSQAMEYSFNQKYAKVFHHSHVIIIANTEGDSVNCIEISHQIKKLMEYCKLIIHVIIGEPVNFGIFPNDDSSSLEIEEWHQNQSSQTGIRIMKELKKNSLESYYINPYNVSFIKKHVSKIKNSDEGMVFVWPAIRYKNEKLLWEGPWRFSFLLSRMVKAKKIIVFQPGKCTIDDGSEVSSISTDEVEDVRRRLNFSSSRNRYLHFKALKHLRDFVESNPNENRGHIINFDKEALCKEILTKRGYGTMISNFNLEINHSIN